MHRFVFFLLLVGISANAMAKWLKIGQVGEATVYVNPDTVHSDAENVQLWTMLNFNALQDLPGTYEKYLSAKIQEQFNCKEERGRMVAGYYYPNSMGYGKPINKDVVVNDWSAIAANSKEELEFKYACSSK